MPTFLDKSLSEQDIRDRFITPVFENAGWDAEHRRAEYSFTAGAIVVNGSLKHRKKGKRADYILLTKENYPIAVVKAKDYNHTPHDGIQQALDYAGILDIPFAYSSNGAAFVEHDLNAGTERELRMDEFPTPLALRERLHEEKKLTPKEEAIIDVPYYSDSDSFEPRYYQRIAINRTVEAVARGQKRILLVMATGTGKTYTAFQIIHRLHAEKIAKRILYIADRNILIDQTMRQDFKPFSKVMTKIKGKQPSQKIKCQSLHKKGDILLARYGGSLGKIFWAEEGAYNVAMAKVIQLFTSNLIDINYLYYYYNCELYQNLVKGGNRSAQGGFNRDDLNSLLFPLPPLHEQERIVEKIKQVLPKLENILH